MGQKFFLMYLIDGQINGFEISMACDISFWCNIVQLSQQNTLKLNLVPSGKIWALFVGLNRAKKYIFQNLVLDTLMNTNKIWRVTYHFGMIWSTFINRINENSFWASLTDFGPL